MVGQQARERRVKVAVVSDTHVLGPEPWLTRVFEEVLARVDAVLHCGDFEGREALWLFESLPVFHGVAGNMDWRLEGALPLARELELEGFRVGMVHGYGVSPGDAPGASRLAAGVAKAFGPGFDLLCFGHTHVFELAKVGGAVALNPGSAGSPRQGAPPSLALVELVAGREPAVARVDLSGFFR